MELTISYDLLCLEGLARALRIFLEKQKPPQYLLSQPAEMQEVFVEASVSDPSPACAAQLNGRHPLYVHTSLVPYFALPVQ